jgi:osmotically-inducible protein OsmY
MPVVDETGRLVGIVTRGDLLKVHLRSDAEIRRDVIAEVRESVLSARGSTVQVTTTDGVVTLTGRVQYRSTAQRITALARRVPGVVEVVARVRYDTDDSPVADSIIGVA